MVKRISGYIRDLPSAEPLYNIPVSILSDVDGSPIPVGEPYNGTANPINTDPSTGLFSWQCDLSPGPIRIEAALGGGKFKKRSGRELMEAGDLFISDMSAAFNVFTNGVVNTLGNKFNCTNVGQNLTLQTGGAMLNGHLLEITANRVLAVPVNPSLPIRKDLIVLRQHIGGTYIGRQEIVLKVGTVNDTDPPDNTNPDLVELKLWRSAIAQSAGTVTLTDLRTYAYALQSPNSVNNLMLTTDGGTTELSTAEARSLLTAPTAGFTPDWNTLSLGELDDVVATAPLNGSFLAWNGTAWAPVFSLTNYVVNAGDSATAADTSSTTSQGTYAQAYHLNFTLGGLAAARWSAHVWAGALYSHTGVTSGVINRRLELDAGNFRDDGGFSVVAQPGWDHYPSTLLLSNLTPGAKVVTLYYRVDPGSSGGTAYVRAPYIHVHAWRTV